MSTPTDNLRELDADRLRAVLPHRGAALLLDRLLLGDPGRAVAFKHVTLHEPCFPGHFPGRPVLPGMLLLESMVQAGSVLCSQAAALGPGATCLLAVERAKFRRPVFPGDRLRLEVAMLHRRQRCARLQATASVRGETAGQAVFTLVRTRPPPPAPAGRHEPDLPAPVLDVNGIMGIIPHRPPFLLIDAILELETNRVLALKNVSGHEPFSAGYFPADPVVPGPLLVEICAQAGAVCILSQPAYRGQTGYFMGVDFARFRRPVRPGDRLLVEIALAAGRSRVGRARGQIRAGSVPLLDTAFTFLIAEDLPAAPAANWN